VSFYDRCRYLNRLSIYEPSLPRYHIDVDDEAPPSGRVALREIADLDDCRSA